MYGKYYSRLSKKVQAELASANGVAEEVLSTMTTVRAFAAEVSRRSSGGTGPDGAGWVLDAWKAGRDVPAWMLEELSLRSRGVRGACGRGPRWLGFLLRLGGPKLQHRTPVVGMGCAGALCWMPE